MATNGTNHNESLSKDEVGWYFVEQYYTTLSKSPNRLHLFYGKTSQLVHDTEAEVAAVSVGRQSIQDRITELNFQDCKVRISNVDSQASLDNILVQVIGEISNKSEDSRKFVQTFVLAEQKTGYFVLNDIFRYIKEEDEEATATEAVAAAPAEESKPAEAEEAKIEEASSVKAEEVAAAKPQLDAAVVDKKLEEVNVVQAPVVPAVATPAEPAVPKAVVPVVPAVVPVATPVKAAEAEKAAQEVAEEEEKKTEVPKEPVPTPAVAPAAPSATAPAPAAAPAPTPAAAPAEPEKPKGPPKPMTWASRAAAAAGPARTVVMPKPAPAAAAPAPASPAASAAAAPAKPAAAAAAASAAAKPAESDASKDSGSEWQTAGADAKRQNRPQSISNAPQDKDSALGYIKYVTDKVDEATLRSHLETFGPVVYFDISRTKNCAFIEFGSPAGYQAAVAANPHTVNGETIVVEPRRPKAGAYGGSNYNPNRGNLSGRGRGGFDGRNGSQGGRGGFSGQNRGRGGAGASRGRGGAQGLAA